MNNERVEVAIGRAGLGWAGPKPGRAKIGPIFSGQNFNSPARPKNRAGRAIPGWAIPGLAKFGSVFFGPKI